MVRKERVWIGRAIRRDRRSANWLSPITFIHLKSTRSPSSSLLRPPPSLPLASFPPFFIPFRVHHAPATFTIAPRSNSTSSPGGRESEPPKLDNHSPPAERPFFERPPRSLSLGRFLKIKSSGEAREPFISLARSMGETGKNTPTFDFFNIYIFVFIFSERVSIVR